MLIYVFSAVLSTQKAVNKYQVSSLILILLLEITTVIFIIILYSTHPHEFKYQFFPKFLSLVQIFPLNSRSTDPYNYLRFLFRCLIGFLNLTSPKQKSLFPHAFKCVLPAVSPFQQQASPPRQLAVLGRKLTLSYTLTSNPSLSPTSNIQLTSIHLSPPPLPTPKSQHHHLLP